VNLNGAGIVHNNCECRIVHPPVQYEHNTAGETRPSATRGSTILVPDNAVTNMAGTRAGDVVTTLLPFSACLKWLYANRSLKKCNFYKCKVLGK
jgi:hypothetical protein